MCRVLFLFAVSASAVPAADLLVVGIDRKIAFTESGLAKVAPTTDEVLVFDIGTDPAEPRLVERIEFPNSLIGPPTNIAVGPDGERAVLADSLGWRRDGDGWIAEPISTVHFFRRVAEAGRPPVRSQYSYGTGAPEPEWLQPSGTAFGPDDRVAIAYRASGRVVIHEFLPVDRNPPGGDHAKATTSPTLLDGVEVGPDAQPAAVAFTPDGERLLVAKFAAHAVGVLEREGEFYRYDRANDLPVGLWPYNVQVSPLGTIALTANNGNAGMPDGHVDTVSVIDLAAEPPRVVDRVVVGDGPEGLAISPDGRWALVTILNGSAPHMQETWYGNPTGLVAVLAIDGTEVTLAGTLEVGRFPEGVGFNKAGTHAYVGDLLDDRVSILAVGEGVTHTGTYLELPGPPASLRTCLP